MTARLRDHPDDLFALVGAAADTLGIDPAFVEKDFWVTEVLRAAAIAATPDATPIFKGGTSLSKAFGIIERFSEDLDLLLVVAGHGERGRDRILKRICEAAGEHIGSEPERKESTRGVKRNVHYTYPRRYGFGAIAERILLELGTRGGPRPRTVRSIRSSVAEHAVNVLGEAPSTWEELASVEVPVLNPERTLVEKLSLLHDLASRHQEADAEQRLEAAGRHVYDVFRLLGHPETRQALRDLVESDRLVQLAEDVEERSRQAGWLFTPRPEEGYAASPAFDPAHPSQKALRVGFDRARGLVWGAFPTFEECGARIRESKDLL